MYKCYKITLSKMSTEKWEVGYEEAEDILQQNHNQSFLTYSQYFKGEEVEGLIRRIDFNFHKSFYLFGMKNTLLIEEIVARKTYVSTFTVLELCQEDELVLYGSERFLGYLLNHRIEFIIGDYDFIISKIAILVSDVYKIYNMRNTEILSTPDFKSSNPEKSTELMKALLEFLQYQLSGMGNSVEDILWGTDNLINNWKYSLEGLNVQHFKDAYKGTPAVIVGAGPSLDKNAHLLNELKEKALIFSVDASLKTLDIHGVVPDSCTTLERTDDPWRFYSNRKIDDETVFVGANIIVGEILDEYKKWIFTGRNGDGFFRTITNYMGMENLDIGMNVANVPFSFARYLGCDPIILVGLDLAYTEGKTHTQPVLDNLPTENKGYYDTLTTMVMGQDGKMVETYIYFLFAKSWFEKRLASDLSFKCFNATEGGATIHNAENIKLSEVLRRLETYPNISERLSQMYDRQHSKKMDALEMTNKGIEFMEQLENKMTEFKEIAEEAIECITENEKFGRVGRVEENRMKIDKSLGASDDMRFLFQPVFINYNRDLHSFPVFLESEDEEALVQRSLGYYQTIIDLVKVFNETIIIYKEIFTSHKQLMEEDIDVK